MISAAEISGDIHAANLVAEFQKIHPEATFFGMGGAKMQAQGVRVLVDITTTSTVGLLEPIKYLPKIYQAYQQMKKALQKEKPDLLIVVDAQGFHMLLLKVAQKLGIKTVYYIAPQEWLWGTKKGGRKVVALTDKIITIFPRAYDFYQKLGADVVYVGHPLLDTVQTKVSKTEFYQKYHLDQDKKILTIFPGSRTQEIKYTFPVLLQAAKKILQSYPQLQIIVSIVNPKFEGKIKEKVAKSGLSNVIFHTHMSSCDLIAHTYLSLTPSGTITLEHAILQTPCIVAYRFSHISYMLLKLVARKLYERVKYISLPNQIMNQLIIPEFVQDAATPDALAKEAFKILDDETEYQNFKEKLSTIKAKLGTPGVVQRAAKAVFIRDEC